MSEIDINVKNLRLFVGALRQVVETLPEAAVVNLKSIRPPVCGAPGCHAGLAMLALDLLGVPDYSGGARYYRFGDQSSRLSDYLLPAVLHDDEGLTAIEKWAQENQDAWGNYYGGGMFASPIAFGQTSYAFPSTVIVDKWAAVLTRLEEMS